MDTVHAHALAPYREHASADIRLDTGDSLLTLIESRESYGVYRFTTAGLRDLCASILDRLADIDQLHDITTADPEDDEPEKAEPDPDAAELEGYTEEYRGYRDRLLERLTSILRPHTNGTDQGPVDTLQRLLEEREVIRLTLLEAFGYDAETELSAVQLAMRAANRIRAWERAADERERRDHPNRVRVSRPMTHLLRPATDSEAQA